LEANAVPPALVPATVRALIGALNVPLSLLWDPAVDGLAAALNKHHAVAYPIVHQQLLIAQQVTRVHGLRPINEQIYSQTCARARP
jgi:hypothetical protein